MKGKERNWQLFVYTWMTFAMGEMRGLRKESLDLRERIKIGEGKKGEFQYVGVNME